MPERLKKIVHKLFEREFIRFLLAGGINAIFSYGMYLVLLLIVRYEAAYTVSYIFGIILSYYLHSILVFRKKMKLLTFLSYPIVYIIQYGLNIVLLKLLVDIAGITTIAAPILVICITIPVTFLVSRFILSYKRETRR